MLMKMRILIISSSIFISTKTPGVVLVLPLALVMPIKV